MAKSWNSTLRAVSDKQKIELARRRKLKAELIAEYGEHCMNCADEMRDWRGISLSHKIPLSAGGKTDRDNCLLECYVCHTRYEKKAWLRPEPKLRKLDD